MPWIVHDKRMMFVDDTSIFSTFEGAVERAISNLSIPAYAVLVYAPVSFRNGRTVSLRTLAGLAGYRHHKAIGAAMAELVEYGFVVAIPYGKNRHQYAGVPQMMRSFPVNRLKTQIYQAA